ncbi:RagB/SusD family nutrient uptake outer membrane protein [Chitinophaga cymbidii]|uniref:Starch-binding protein n=1 Tax=Chitinophaga cymbidii TaxID=1096750 RepID=A0A512RFW1_9BACT|nr:RagB/SusD family nutrient uptake outer membrane protein [Chitinophaga cymbidii]GEP94592.1 starch-binding protein [Chitinophaga cymbidii]
MKSTTFIFILLAAMAGTSCKKLLDTKPTDFLSPVNYYQTDKQLDFALAAVYDVMGDAGFYKQIYTARMGNEADDGFYFRNTVIAGVQVYNFSPTDNDVQNLWQSLYDGINRANMLLAAIPNAASASDSAKSRIRGEALFLRGYYYFMLVQHWGGVPLITEPTTSVNNVDIAKSTIREVYTQILKDMEEAEGLVLSSPAAITAGRVNKSAVRGLLARVNLFMAGYPLQETARYTAARDWALKIMDDMEAGHRLNPDYQQIFINYAQDKYDIKESIWEVEFWGNNTNAYNETGCVGAWLGIQSSDQSIGVGYGFVNATSRLYKLYNENDLRRDWNIAPFSYSGTTKVAKASTPASALWTRNCGKFRREYETLTPKSNNATPQNMPLLRYSDVLLMFAEADNEVNKQPSARAFQALNEVRRRAFGKLLPDATNITEFDISGLDYESFQQEIRDERSRELCFELFRKQDLIRWGIFITNMKAIENMVSLEASGQYYSLAFRNVSARHLLFPIPARELALNKALRQNDNW